MRLILLSACALALMSLKLPKHFAFPYQHHKMPKGIAHKYGEWPDVAEMRSWAWLLRNTPITEEELVDEEGVYRAESPFDLQLFLRIKSRRHHVFANDYKLEMSELENVWKGLADDREWTGRTREIQFWRFFVARRGKAQGIPVTFSADRFLRKEE